MAAPRMICSRDSEEMVPIEERRARWYEADGPPVDMAVDVDEAPLGEAIALPPRPGAEAEEIEDVKSGELATPTPPPAPLPIGTSETRSTTGRPWLTGGAPAPSARAAAAASLVGRGG